MKITPSSGVDVRTMTDYEAIRQLALASGLEDGTFQQTLVAYGCYRSDELIGCGTLRLDGERYSVDWLAVSDHMRGKGLGLELVSVIADEARRRGARKLWAIARVPGFYEKIGFRHSTEDLGEGPTLENCLHCHQFHKTCFPAVMVMDLRNP